MYCDEMMNENDLKVAVICRQLYINQVFINTKNKYLEESKTLQILGTQILNPGLYPPKRFSITLNMDVSTSF